MKGLQFTFFSIALLFPLSLSAEITRDQADATVLEYIQNEVTEDYILLRNDNPLDEDGRTSITWNNSSLHAESLNVEYPCWVYCLYNSNVTAPRTLLFLFVNKADGSLLTVKNRQASGANSENWTEIARTGATLPACTTRTDDVISHYLTDHQTTILKEFPPYQSVSSYIVIAKLFDDTELTAYLVENFDSGFKTHYRICNYPQYAKEWDIPENGLPVLLSGKAYPPSFNPGFQPANRAFFDLELTTLRKLDERELLKSKLLGKWVRSGEEDSYIYAFSDNDTIYIKTPEGDTPYKWPYQAIAGDSIQITSLWNWTTHNKVVFYSNDSIRIEDFLPGFAAVYPPHFADIVLKRRLNDEMKLTGTQWKLTDIRNLATDELKTLEPHSRFENECFSFTFKNDTAGFGRSCTNLIGVNIKGTNGRYLGCMTAVYEGTDDCIYFSDILRLIDDCFFKEDLLIFAYTQDNVRYYLQFKQVKE
jgi:hypothetical protein